MTKLTTDDRELQLTVCPVPEGIEVSSAEIAVFCGFYLHIEPVAERTAAALTDAVAAMPLALRDAEAGWQCSAAMPGEKELTLAVDPHPAWMYSVDGVPVTANQWAADLFEEE